MDVVSDLLQVLVNFGGHNILQHGMLLQVFPELYLRGYVLITQLFVLVHHAFEDVVPVRQREPFEASEVLVHHFCHLGAVGDGPQIHLDVVLTDGALGRQVFYLNVESA